MLWLMERKARLEDAKRSEEQLAEARARNDLMMTLTENMMQQAADRAAAEERAEARLEADRDERREREAATQADRELLADALARFTDAINALDDRYSNSRRRNLRNGSSRR